HASTLLDAARHDLAELVAQGSASEPEGGHLFRILSARDLVRDLPDVSLNRLALRSRAKRRIVSDRAHEGLRNAVREGRCGGRCRLGRLELDQGCVLDRRRADALLELAHPVMAALDLRPD